MAGIRNGLLTPGSYQCRLTSSPRTSSNEPNRVSVPALTSIVVLTPTWAAVESCSSVGEPALARQVRMSKAETVPDLVQHHRFEVETRSRNVVASAEFQILRNGCKSVERTNGVFDRGLQCSRIRISRIDADRYRDFPAGASVVRRVSDDVRIGCRKTRYQECTGIDPDGAQNAKQTIPSRLTATRNPIALVSGSVFI